MSVSPLKTDADNLSKPGSTDEVLVSLCEFMCFDILGAYKESGCKGDWCGNFRCG